MDESYTIDQVVSAINKAKPTGSKKLTRSALQAWRGHGVGPKGNFQGKQVEWKIYHAYTAYVFKMLLDAGIRREYAERCLASLEVKVRLNNVGDYAWFDIYRDSNGKEWPGFIDEPGRGREYKSFSSDSKAVLLVSINIVESFRVIKEALSKI